MKDELLRLQHHSAVEIWEHFCRLHHDLYELTCDEYQTLLSGEIEGLEAIIERKEVVMNEIAKWEGYRASLISDLNKANVSEQPITNVKDLLAVLQPAEEKLPIPALRNLNSLLIDVITRIQEQNKRNQVFLNKAMSSLRELREGFSGKKQYTTYGANGMTRSAAR
ncbi:MAG: flagellar protein FlgN [Bacteriovoracaceae bacterium]|nr:flagellar protein FlgN [Bacteriovoracaceae bacterium]